MAPSFLSKLVRAPAHSRERSGSGEQSPRSSTSTKSRSRAPSTTHPPPLPPRPTAPNHEATPTAEQENRIPSFVTTNVDGVDDPGHDSDSTFPSVTVIPPSPLITDNKSLSPSSSHTSIRSSGDHRSNVSPNRDHNPSPRTRTISNSSSRGRTVSRASSKTSLQANEDNLPTPTVATTRSLSPKTPKSSQQSTPSSTSPQSQTAIPHVNQPGPLKSSAMPSLLQGNGVRKQSSKRSLKQPPPPITITHARAATAPGGHQSTGSQDGQTTLYNSPEAIAESPTNNSLPDYPPPLPTPDTGYLTARSTRDTDAISVASAASQAKEKKRSWRRPTATKKPTGLASAIAASSLSLANHSLTAGQQAHLSAAASTSSNSPVTSRKQRASGSPPYSAAPSMSSRHVKSKSTEMAPATSKKAIRSATSLPRSRTAMSVYSDNNSEYYGDDRPEYYSGLEESGSDDDGGSDSEDDLMDLDLGEDNIPVTGFAVASNRRNADFHDLFSNVPEGDYLIDDYGCALQREILIQGRIYISENHVCFHANIFGWITDLSIPINEITSMEKKMTAFVIPNGIQITTRQAKYTFASFLSRDTTFDVIYNIWKLERQDAASISSGRGSYGARVIDQVAQNLNGAVTNTLPARKATQCACGKAGEHYSETALEAVVPGTPERIHNLIFASGFMKDFMAVNQKLLDIQISDWAPVEPGSILLARNMSYIKPLNGSLGPKQTKCEIRDETVHCDFEDYLTMLTTTRTPEVPSGNVFAVKTRTCIMWASAVSTKIVVTTQVEWTGRSFIKGIIERSAIDGQKVYHCDLEKAMRAYIEEHQSEFVPEGIDPAVVSLVVTREVTPTAPVSTEIAPPSQEDERKRREHDRNRRGLQWAYETFSGASQVAKQSTVGALELVKEAWEQSTTTTILYFVIVGLVLSNLWTLTLVGGREEVVRRKILKKEEEREKLVQGVVTALWDELGVAKVQAPAAPEHPAVSSGRSLSWQEQIAELQQTLDIVEERVRNLRSGLTSVGERLDAVD